LPANTEIATGREPDELGATVALRARFAHPRPTWIAATP
jgi:hypothetical protein